MQLNPELCGLKRKMPALLGKTNATAIKWMDLLIGFRTWSASFGMSARLARTLQTPLHA